jgi:excisionase family DNA binding protein
MTPEIRLLTVRQAARYLGRTEGAVRHLMRPGKWASAAVVKIGRSVRLDAQTLDRLIAGAKNNVAKGLHP